MKLENQVCILKLSKKLNDLGVKQDSLFYHVIDGNDKMLLNHKSNVTWNGRKCLNYSAFTVAELGRDYYFTKKTGSKTEKDWECRNEYDSHITFEKTEANARAKMLLYLIKTRLVKVN